MVISKDKPIKIAVIGDVHDQWEEADRQSLKHLGVELVLFVGDFGNESLPVVRAIAGLDIPKAAILGNHDAWHTATDWGRSQCPYDRHQEDRVREQLNVLGEAHVGYGKLDFPELGLTVVGSRPFTWGGSEWKYSDFYRERFGVGSFEASAARIMAAVRQAGSETVIFLGHNGPTGLGDLPEDPCGKDWNPIGGDFGDPDFEEAIVQTRALGKQIPLVAFGHMHHRLRHTQKRLRRCVHVSSEGTVYLNAASVPRIVQTPTDRRRNFSIVSLCAGAVEQISLVWVNQDFRVASEQILYCRTSVVAQPAIR
ncbi:TIGR04168 family protein [Kamptonema formosum]|uniref:TIGR04168 family protein n=1 Tax=Kamptonema formosum TaxID=331992 RepID=UPI00034927DA|nr:TIGR04168 family protein [Oscillatoria sp. PCC 10802]